MAARRPVVLAGGRFKQLPAGDRLDVPAEWDALKAPAIASGALVIDLATPAGFRVALNQNVIALSFANVPSGRVVVFTVTWVQDATGGRAVSFPASVKADGGGMPVQPATGANAVTVQSFYTDDGGATVWQAGAGAADLATRVSALENRPRGVGDGQSWASYKASRAYSTTFTNSTGRPIQIAVFGGPSSANNGGLGLKINGMDIYNAYAPSGLYTSCAVAVIPTGATYQVVQFNASLPLYDWWELR